MKKNKCTHCNKDIPADSLLCPYCGEKVQKEIIPPALPSKQVKSIMQKKDHKSAALISISFGIFFFLVMIVWLFTSNTNSDKDLSNIPLLISCFSFPFFITGLILGILGVRSSLKRIAIPGIIFNSIGIILWLLFLTSIMPFVLLFIALAFGTN